VKIRYNPSRTPPICTPRSINIASASHGAKRVQQRINRCINLLSMHPEDGTRTDDPVIRRLTTPPYPFLIFYEIASARSSFTPSVTPPAIHPACRELARRGCYAGAAMTPPAPRALPAHGQAELGAAPQHVIGKPRHSCAMR